MQSLNALTTLRHAVVNAGGITEKEGVTPKRPHTSKDNDLARFTSFYTIHEISQHKIRSNQASIEVQQRLL
jgi:hypothetical protein